MDDTVEENSKKDFYFPQDVGLSSDSDDDSEDRALLLQKRARRQASEHPDESKHISATVENYIPCLKNHVTEGLTDNCHCNDCFAMKCKAYELLSHQVDYEYFSYLAVVNMKRGHCGVRHMSDAKATTYRQISDRCCSIEETKWRKEYQVLLDTKKSKEVMEQRREASKPQNGRDEIVKGLMEHLRCNNFNFFKNGSTDEETNGHVKHCKFHANKLRWYRFWS